MTKSALFWSGGKDSWVALEQLVNDGNPPDMLVSVVSERDGWVRHQGVFASMLEAQARSMGFAWLPIALGETPSNETYVRNVTAALKAVDIATIAFGDLHLRDVRLWRQDAFGDAFTLEFPIWLIGPDEAAYRVWNRRAEVVVTAIRNDLGVERLMQPYSPAFVASLPSTIDSAGEGGEFHTFVTCAPGWTTPVELPEIAPWSDESMHYGLKRA